MATQDGVSSKNFQGYANDFVARSKCQFRPMVGLDGVLKIAARVDALTYEGF
jgi:hypothetical protein